MKPFSRRQKLIGGVFVIISTAWVFDMITGGPGPAPAAAAPALALPGQPAELPPDPADLQALIGSLLQNPPSRSLLPFERARRDLFVPTGRFQQALAPLVADGGAEEARERADSRTKPSAFEARHELQGILTGPLPLALIDGLLLPRGALIEGYRLVEIRADAVVFVKGQERLILRVSPVRDR